MSSEEELANKIIYLYELFYQKAQKRPHFKLNLELKKQDVVLANFVKRLKKHYKGILSIGSHTLIRYYVFQFQYWIDKTTERPLSFGWVVGKKAFERWVNRHTFHTYVSNNRIVKDLELDLPAIYRHVEQLPLMRDPKAVSSAETIEKRRFFNTEGGLIHCADFTTLYSRGMPCALCKFRNECKDLLRVTYPPLYYARLFEPEEYPHFMPL